ncbi:MAG: DUF4363 family protein [Ruminococcaceae bacterium]|nr:DUF4363 family protein [Oscillospiraceae bacterium]
MKRLIIAAVLLVLVITTYLSSFFYINKCCNNAKMLLENSVVEYKKQKTAEPEALKLEKYWDEKEKTLSVFVNHDRIDDIEKAISLLNVYAKSKDNELFYEYAENVGVLIHQILEDTKVSMHSVF